MIKIEVTDQVSKPRKAGDSSLREQKAYIQLSDKYPQNIKLTVWEGNDPLMPGLYHFDPVAGMFVGQYDSLSFRLKLEHLTKVPAKAKLAE